MNKKAKDLPSCHFRDLGPMYLNCKNPCIRRTNYRSPTWFGEWVTQDYIPKTVSECKDFHPLAIG